MAKFALDTAHSELEFTVKHMMVTKVKGTFGDWSIISMLTILKIFQQQKLQGKQAQQQSILR